MRVNRNDLCPCGSGKEYERCCLSLAEHIQKVMGSEDTLISLQDFAEGNHVDVVFAKSFYSADTIDLLTFRDTELVLLRNLTEAVESIELCAANGFFNPALKLIYSAIDNLAYLACPETEHQSVHKREFVRWAKSFLLPDSGLSCTAEELYASRCGLLHQNTVATCNLPTGMKRIVYTLGTAKAQEGIEHIDESKRDEYRFVSIDSLRGALHRGTVTFLKAVSQEPLNRTRVLKKAAKYFSGIA